MALKPLRPCRHQGCAALTREGHCPKHKPQKAPRRVSAGVSQLVQPAYLDGRPAPGAAPAGAVLPRVRQAW